MKIEMWPLSRLKVYDKNPRVISDRAVEILARSIKEFGFRVPIVVDKRGVIVAGHARLKAAQVLNLDEVPVHVAGDLTKAQLRTFRIMDNRAAEMTHWDHGLLAVEMETLQKMGVDLASAGWTPAEAHSLLNPAGDNDTDGDDSDSDSGDAPPASAYWPTITLKVPHATKALYDDLMARTVGDEAARFRRILDAADGALTPETAHEQDSVQANDSEADNGEKEETAQ